MDKETKAVNTEESAAIPKESATTQDDAEAKIAALEAEKARLIEEKANWKLAALKAKGKKVEEPAELEGDDRLRQIAREELANSRIAQIDTEREAQIARTLKENRELKLALANKTTATPSAALGTHSEAKAVQDTLITPEQLTAFKARGWSDKDIERYKRNLQKASTGIGGR